MKELSLNILDIFNNSLKANATLISVEIDINEKDNLLTIIIEDNGIGMDAEFLKKVTDPFTTSRTTRPVGLGLPFFKQTAEECEGNFHIESQPGIGTKVTSSYRLDHIDRMPLGNIPDTVVLMVMPLKEDMNLRFTQKFNDKSFTFDTSEIREILGAEVPINTVDVLNWVKDCIKDEYENLGCDLRKF